MSRWYKSTVTRRYDPHHDSWYWLEGIDAWRYKWVHRLMDWWHGVWG